MLTNRCRVAAVLPFLAQALFTQTLARAQMPLVPPPATSKPEDRCLIEGHVTNAATGEPVRKVTVRLEKQLITPLTDLQKGPQSMQGYTATSQPDGTFRLENVEPGNYRLWGHRGGYLNSEYGAKSIHQRGSTLTLTAGQQVSDISLRMTPQAVITGKVLDQDGDPVEGVMVQLVHRDWQSGKLRHQMLNGTNTNDLGEYRFANVSPGKYYVLAQTQPFAMDRETQPEPGKPDVRPARTFYPEAPSLEAATPLEVAAGQDLAGIDIRMRTTATFHIRGKLVGILPDNSAERLSVGAFLRSDENNMFFMFDGHSIIGKERTFDIAGLAPGAYTLRALMQGRRGAVVAQQDVDVGQADVNDVQLTIVQPGTLHGQVLLDGSRQAGTPAPDVKSLRMFLIPVESSGINFGQDQGTPKDDGTFAIENVVPGKYYMRPHPPQGMYLKSVRFGNQEVLGKEIDLTQGFGQISIIFRYGVAEVDGTVQLPQASTASADTAASQANSTPAFQVALVPEILNEDGSGIRYDSSGAGGAFSIRQLPPGRYKAYALEQTDDAQLDNPDVLKQLEGKGVELDLKENDKKQIELPLITADEMRQIYARLGIDVQ